MDVEKGLVLDELQRIGASSTFENKPVMQKLLAYLVNEFLEGRSDQISGFSIGVDVFARAQSADPTSTALVRNNALRLRRLLETYYLGEGKTDPVRINIPRGKYVPEIAANDRSALAESGFDNVQVPTAAVLPFRNLSIDPDLDFAALGLSQELSDALACYQDVRVIGMTSRDAYDDATLSLTDEFKDKKIQYLVDGDLRRHGQKIRIGIRLLDVLSGGQIWSSHYALNLEEHDLFEVQEQIARRVASSVGGDYGHINQRRMRAIQRSRPRTLKEQDVLLMQYSKNVVVNEKVEREFQETVVRALAEDPESALLNALLAGTYVAIWQMAIPGTDDPLGKVAYYAEKAYAIDPGHHVVQSVLGNKYFLFDEKDRFLDLFEQIHDALPNSPMRSGGWALYLSFFGEWERGKELLDRIIADNAQLPGWLYSVECMYHYRLHDYESALVGANKFRIPGLFWGPVLRIAVLGQLGRPAEAETEIQTLFEWRPDFAEMGRTLFGRMFKEDSLIEHLVEGLGKAGLKVA